MKGYENMELKQCVDTILLLLDDHGEIFDDGEKKALNKLLVTAEAVEKWQGKLPEKKLMNYLCGPNLEAVSDERILAYNRAIDDCAAAVVANMPTKREVSNIVGELAGYASLCWEPKPTGIFDSTKASKAVGEYVDAIYNLIVGKVRGK